MVSNLPENESSETLDSAELSANEDEVMAASALTEKEMERERIQKEIEEFLSRGGKITCVESDVMSDPPKAPESNYGGQPI